MLEDYHLDPCPCLKKKHTLKTKNAVTPPTLGEHKRKKKIINYSLLWGLKMKIVDTTEFI